MITTILYPEHFAVSEVGDIERELIGLTLDQASHDASQHAHGLWFTPMIPSLRKALIEQPDEVRIAITKVRTARYHPPSRPGWTIIGRMRWGKHKTNLIDVLWIPRGPPWS